MYNINSFIEINKVKSSNSIEVDISNILNSSNFGTLYINSLKIISSSNTSETIEKTYPFDTFNFPFDENLNKIILDSSLNLWYEFNFAFKEVNNNYLRLFILPNYKLHIRTCAFQCGSCVEDYYKCDNCRDSNYTVINNSNDSNCYHKEQLLEGYIYDPSTGYFEECYPTC